MRRCVGCMESKPKKDLMRIAFYEGEVSLDPTGRAKGRGVYLCPNSQCLRSAKKKNALQRSFGGEIREEKIEAMLKELEVYEEKNG